MLAGVDLGNGPDEDETWRDPDGLHLGCQSCWDEPLTHGPLLGAVRPDSARILLRTDATRRVGLHLGPLGGADPVAQWLYPSPGRDFTAVAEAGGLLPDTDYVYWFEVDGEPVGPLAGFRTPPPDGEPGGFRFAFGASARFEEQEIFARVAAEDPDLFLFIGNSHRADSDDLASLRWFYRWSLERGERAALAAATPTLATWDDHDFLGLDSDASTPGRDVALRAFAEYWANPGFGLPEVPGVFFTLRRGDVDFFVLDERYWRGEAGSMLGEGQRQWLQDALSASTATWKLLAGPAQWAPGDDDSWGGFLAERDALFDFIRDEAVGGVVLLSGGIHRSELRLIERQSDGAYDLPELSSSPLADWVAPCPDPGADGLVACVGDRLSFVTVEIDSTVADPLLRAEIVDEAGVSREQWTLLRSELDP